MSSVLTSCGSETPAEKPELMEPAIVTESCRKVERRDIGDINFLKGAVVARGYPVFTDHSIALDELRVSPGDHVEKGDVIATGNTESYDEEIRSLEAEAEMQRRMRAASIVISEKEELKLSYRKAACEKVGYTDEAEGYAQQMKIEQENRRYQTAEYDAELAEISKQLAELRKNRSKLVFTAPHSGYVTFLKDISSGNGVEANENIAVISDYDDLYIETTEKTLEDYKYGKYDEKYILMGGVKYKVTEEEYTAAERSFASMQKLYPPVRFHAEGVKLEMGTTLLIYFSEKSCTNVLAIGNDSVYREGDISYCYVRAGAGDRERREITVGERDSLYTEILAGLSEGEQVYYENKSVLPVKYEAYEVETKDYVEESQTSMASRLLTEHEVYNADLGGTILKGTSSGGEVKKGDEVLLLSVHTSRADLAETRNQITGIEQGHTAQLKQFDAREKEAKDAIEAAKHTVIPEIKKEEAPRKAADDPEAETYTTNAPNVTDAPEVGVDATNALEAETDATEEKSEEDEKKEKDAIRDSLYVKEQMEAELEIIAQERSVESAEYNYNLSEAKKLLQEQSVGSGDGEVSVRAEHDGELGVSHLEAGGVVYKGSYLFSVNWAGKKLMRFSMQKTRGKEPGAAAVPGQEIEFHTEDGKVVKGKCVAGNGGDKNYLFTRDGKEYLTHSQVYSEGIEQQFFAELEDDSVFDEGKAGTVKFKGVMIPGGIVVPAKAVYTEVDKVTQESVTFVWKVDGDELVKQPVVTYEGELVHERLILSGIQPGDRIALE